MSSKSTPPSQPSDEISHFVPAPFDNPNHADIILRSADGIDFYVCKGLLAFASPVFSDMLVASTPKERGEITKAEITKDALPIVTLTETAVILHLILRVLYPMKQPALNETSVIIDAFVAASKYEMTHVMDVIELALLDIARLKADGSQAIHVYMMACSLEKKDLARGAALESLKYPLRDGGIPPFLGQAPVNLWRLFRYRDRAIREIMSLFGEELHNENSSFFSQVWTFFLCLQSCGGYRYFALDGSAKPKITNRGISSAWENLRLLKLQETPSAPLAPLRMVMLKEASQKISCTDCSQRINQEEYLKRIAAAFNEEMLRLVSKIDKMNL